MAVRDSVSRKHVARERAGTLEARSESSSLALRAADVDQPARELSPQLRGGFSLLIIVLLLVPIRAGATQGVDVSIGFASFVLAIPFLVLLPRTFSGWHLALTFALSAAVVLIGLLIVTPLSIRPLFGFAYFWLPYILFPAGWWLIRSREEMAVVLRRAAFISAVVGIGITVSLLATGTPVRIEGSLMGNFAGLPLYATFGVNSLATLYAIQWCLVLIDLIGGQQRTVLDLLRVVGTGMLVVPRGPPLSRGSVLACVAFSAIFALAFAAIQTESRHRRRGGVGGDRTVAFVKYGDVIAFAWSAKLDAAEAREDFSTADQATAGRATLYAAAIRIWTDHSSGRRSPAFSAPRADEADWRRRVFEPA